MFIELVDELRCPRPHEETWLVASAHRTVERDIVEGTLGCPICHAEYPIRDGVVWFDETGMRRTSATTRPTSDAELALRVAAFLDLSDRGFALLAGSWGAVAPSLRSLVPTHLVLLNPTVSVDAGAGISILQVPSAIPLASATCRGVALDGLHTTSDHVGAAIRILTPRGRLVAPATTPVPSDVTELARDDRLWVAERAAAPPELVMLRPRGS